jgi:hypothetical protein
LKTIDTKAADIAFQMPIYPMLDHRMATKSAREMSGLPFGTDAQMLWRGKTILVI